MNPSSLEIIQGEADQTHGQVAAGVFYFIYFSLALLGLLCSMGFPLVVASGGCSLLWCSAAHCSGFSCWRAWALEHRLSSWGARALVVLWTWGLPGPGMEPVPPVLAGGLVTTEAPEKPCCVIKFKHHTEGKARCFNLKSHDPPLWSWLLTSPDL